MRTAEKSKPKVRIQIGVYARSGIHLKAAAGHAHCCGSRSPDIGGGRCLLCHRSIAGILSFFIVPISFFTWFVGRHAGLIASGVSAGFTLAANLESPVYAVHPHVAYWNALVWLAFFVVITIIIAELKVLYLRERRLSRVDHLTGIATRLAFYEVAEGEKNRARRYRHSMTIAYLDRITSKR